jgi:prephenate dehydrogenase
MADTRRRDSSPAPFERVAIVGFGLMGGSFAMAYKAHWPSALVIAVDRKDVIEMAMRMGAADVGGDDLVLAAEAQLILFAAPVCVNIRLLAELADYVPGEALVTDVGSTKREMVNAARALPPRLTFVGGHPLAGAAVGGLDAARPDLFAGRPWLLTPGGVGDDQVPARFRALLEAIGATVHILAPDAHDALAAYISHLPQLVATALMHVVGNTVGDDGLAFAGRGLRDTTRLASSPAAVWHDIVATNHDRIGEAIDQTVDALRRMQASGGRAGDGGRADELTRMFDSAALWKRALERHFEGS